MSETPRFWYGPGGMLLCDRQIQGITHTLTGANERLYGASHYVADGFKRSACERIAAALGGTFTYIKPGDVDTGESKQTANNEL